MLLVHSIFAARYISLKKDLSCQKIQIKNGPMAPGSNKKIPEAPRKPVWKAVDDFSRS